MPETTVTVEAVAGVKEGTNNKGQAWKKWSFKADDTWYSTFVEGIGTRFVKGETYTIDYSENEYGRTVKSVKSNGSSPAAQTHNPTPYPGFTGGEKDRSIVRQVAWKAAATITASLMSGASENAAAEAFRTASKLAHGIENDIYREQPKPPAPVPATPVDDGLDIPFQPTI